MAAPIRPHVWPTAPAPIAPSRAEASLSAQKAFFQAALAGKPVPPPAAATVQAAAPARVARAAEPTQADTSGERIPRPGSILNILV